MASLQAVTARRAQLRGALVLPPSLVLPQAWFDSAQNFMGATWRSRVGSLVVEQQVSSRQFALVDTGLLVNPGCQMSQANAFDFSSTQAYTIMLKLTTVSLNGTNSLYYYDIDQPGVAETFAYSYNNSYEGAYLGMNNNVSLASANGQPVGTTWWAANDVASGRTNAIRTYTNNQLNSSNPRTAAAALLGVVDFEIGNRVDASNGTFALRHVLVFDQLLTGSERQAWMDYLA